VEAKEALAVEAQAAQEDQAVEAQAVQEDLLVEARVAQEKLAAETLLAVMRGGSSGAGGSSDSRKRKFLVQK